MRSFADQIQHSSCDFIFFDRHTLTENHACQVAAEEANTPQTDHARNCQEQSNQRRSTPARIGKQGSVGALFACRDLDRFSSAASVQVLSVVGE
jgi:hypothetical protein